MITCTHVLDIYNNNHFGFNRSDGFMCTHVIWYWVYTSELIMIFFCKHTHTCPPPYMKYCLLLHVHTYTLTHTKSHFATDHRTKTNVCVSRLQKKRKKKKDVPRRFFFFQMHWIIYLSFIYLPIYPLSKTYFLQSGNSFNTACELSESGRCLLGWLSDIAY